MKRSLFHICMFSLCLFIMGCSNASDPENAGHGHSHDHNGHHHHDHSGPKASYDVLVTQICEHRDAIKSAFDADNKDEAHDPLHEIGHLVGQLPDAAAETDMSEADWNQVKEASDSLMESFGKVDAMFHGDDEGVEFSEVEQNVQDAITVLQEKVEVVSSANQETQP